MAHPLTDHCKIWWWKWEILLLACPKPLWDCWCQGEVWSWKQNQWSLWHSSCNCPSKCQHVPLLMCTGCPDKPIYSWKMWEDLEFSSPSRLILLLLPWKGTCSQGCSLHLVKAWYEAMAENKQQKETWLVVFKALYEAMKNIIETTVIVSSTKDESQELSCTQKVCSEYSYEHGWWWWGQFIHCKYPCWNRPQSSS